jgi:hypothetical protein
MERRGAQRIEYVCEVECEGAVPDPVRPRMRDLSATGAFIESSAPAPEGVRLRLRFLLPSGEIAVSAEVARIADLGMGVRFLGLTEDERRLIEAAVAEEAEAGAP